MIDGFDRKLRFSGFSLRQREEIIHMAISAEEHRRERLKERKSMFFSSKETEEERRLKKLTGAESWFKEWNTKENSLFKYPRENNSKNWKKCKRCMAP